jgi:hypothetical protein
VKYAFRFRAAYRLGKQLKNLATELVDGVRERRGARKALDEAKTVAKDCNSFAPGAPVLLAARDTAITSSLTAAGKPYYSGMFGPGDTAAGVQYRHANNGNRFDGLPVAPGWR